MVEVFVVIGGAAVGTSIIIIFRPPFRSRAPTASKAMMMSSSRQLLLRATARTATSAQAPLFTRAVGTALSRAGTSGTVGALEDGARSMSASADAMQPMSAGFPVPDASPFVRTDEDIASILSSADMNPVTVPVGGLRRNAMRVPSPPGRWPAVNAPRRFLSTMPAEANAASASFPEMFKDEVKEAPAKPKGSFFAPPSDSPNMAPGVDWGSHYKDKAPAPPKEEFQKKVWTSPFRGPKDTPLSF